MSLRYEQYSALSRSRQFLRELLSGPRLPMKELRKRASGCLKHFPFLTEQGQPIWSRDTFTQDEPMSGSCPVCKSQDDKGSNT